MEAQLRCRVPDRPGALAALAGAIGEAGGDIQAVDVVEAGNGVALDDLVVVVDSAEHLDRVLASVRKVDDVVLVHAGPSRGHPGDAVSRIAVLLEALLNGAMTVDNGVASLLGGLLRADSARWVPGAEVPPETDRTLLAAVDHRVLVLERAYRFTDTERGRAAALLQVALEAARTRAQ
jgi:hypothetical protein